MDVRIQFGKIHIIEWLRPGDQPTGAQLLDELEPMGLVSRPVVLVQLHRVGSMMIAGRVQAFIATP